MTSDTDPNRDISPPEFLKLHCFPLRDFELVKVYESHIQIIDYLKIINTSLSKSLEKTSPIRKVAFYYQFKGIYLQLIGYAEWDFFKVDATQDEGSITKMDSDEYKKLKKIVAEFSTRFSRNYIYPLQLHMNNLNKFITSGRAMEPKNSESLKKALANVYQMGVQAVLAYTAYIAPPERLQATEKLSILMQTLIDVHNICRNILIPVMESVGHGTEEMMPEMCYEVLEKLANKAKKIKPKGRERKIKAPRVAVNEKADDLVSVYGGKLGTWKQKAETMAKLKQDREKRKVQIKNVSPTDTVISPKIDLVRNGHEKMLVRQEVVSADGDVPTEIERFTLHEAKTKEDIQVNSMVVLRKTLLEALRFVDLGDEATALTKLKEMTVSAEKQRGGNPSNVQLLCVRSTSMDAEDPTEKQTEENVEENAETQVADEHTSPRSAGRGFEPEKAMPMSPTDQETRRTPRSKRNSHSGPYEERLQSTEETKRLTRYSSRRHLAPERKRHGTLTCQGKYNTALNMNAPPKSFECSGASGVCELFQENQDNKETDYKQVGKGTQRLSLKEAAPWFQVKRNTQQLTPKFMEGNNEGAGAILERWENQEIYGNKESPNDHEASGRHMPYERKRWQSDGPQCESYDESEEEIEEEIVDSSSSPLRQARSGSLLQREGAMKQSNVMELKVCPELAEEWKTVRKSSDRIVEQQCTIVGSVADKLVEELVDEVLAELIDDSYLHHLYQYELEAE